MLFFSKFTITGHSMEPTFKDGDRILTSKILYFFKHPQINDIVVFRNKEMIFIKRIAEIIEDKYFVKGDNSKDSLDSKSFGSISGKQILGKFIVKL